MKISITFKLKTKNNLMAMKMIKKILYSHKLVRRCQQNRNKKLGHFSPMRMVNELDKRREKKFKNRNKWKYL